MNYRSEGLDELRRRHLDMVGRLVEVPYYELRSLILRISPSGG